VEDFQTLQFQLFKFGGGGRNRATHARLMQSKSLISLGISIKINYPDLTNFNPVTEEFTEGFLR
jgi:hypothetical protein